MNPKPAVIVLAVVLAVPAPVDAYVDPGVGSLLLQALIGGIAAFLAILSMYWKRLTTFLSSTKLSRPPAPGETPRPEDR